MLPIKYIVGQTQNSKRPKSKYIYVDVGRFVDRQTVNFFFVLIHLISKAFLLRWTTNEIILCPNERKTKNKIVKRKDDVSVSYCVLDAVCCWISDTLRQCWNKVMVGKSESRKRRKIERVESRNCSHNFKYFFIKIWNRKFKMKEITNEE